MGNRAARDLTAILLCGGRGERLRPFTDSMPKALVPLRGRPLLEHLMAGLAADGLRRFAVCVGYKAEAIEDYLKEHSNPAWQVSCVDSGDASMCDRILDARRYVPDRGLVCYGDTLANVDLPVLLGEHQNSGALATVTVYPLQSPFGIVRFDESQRVVGLDEKPQLPYWINIGFILLEPAAFDRLRPGTDLVVFLSGLAADGLLHAYTHRGRHLTVNTAGERASAEMNMIDFYSPISEPST
jgi:glucose-1-phosphate cytidylyltransferase